MRQHWPTAAARLVRASDCYNFKSAAFEVMEHAYIAASANGTLPASARQVMYQARPLVQEKMGGQQLSDQYFLPDNCCRLMEEHEVIGTSRTTIAGTSPSRIRAFDRARHPHSAVRDYLAGSARLNSKSPASPPGTSTHSDRMGFGAVLFIEKEGFVPLFRRFISPSAMTSRSCRPRGCLARPARDLIDSLCRQQVPARTARLR